MDSVPTCRTVASMALLLPGERVPTSLLSASPATFLRVNTTQSPLWGTVFAVLAVLALCALGCAAPARGRRSSPSAAVAVSHHPHALHPSPGDEGSRFVERALQHDGLRFGTDGSTRALWRYLPDLPFGRLTAGSPSRRRGVFRHRRGRRFAELRFRRQSRGPGHRSGPGRPSHLRRGAGWAHPNELRGPRAPEPSAEPGRSGGEHLRAGQGRERSTGCPLLCR